MKQLRSLSFFKTVSLHKPRSAHLPAGPGLKNYAALLGRSWHKLAVLGLFGLGLLLGAKTAAGAPSGWQARLMELLRTQRLNRAGNSLLANAIGYFGGDLLFLLAAFLLGLCAGGLPLLLVLPVLRGLGLGVVSGWLYMSYGASGVGYSVLVLYPAAVASVLVMLAGCKESMLMSGDMLLMVTGKLERAETGLRMYATRYLMLLAVSMLAALLDALCFAAFSGVFEL